MTNNLLITMVDGEKLVINEDTFVTCIVNDENSVKEDSMFYSRMIYQNYLLQESNPVVSAQTSSQLVGVMGLFASCDFFTFSSNIDLNDVVVYKSSAIKSIQFS